MLLDAGFLVSLDRGDAEAQEFLTAALRNQTLLSTTHPVVAQVWRDGARQVRLTRALTTIRVHPFDDGRAVGRLLAAAGTADVVDAHLVVSAIARDEPILTSDLDDLEHLAACLPHPGPRILHWT
ncbi:MAG: twitching motility protein PilT [Solirubrobacterales bacterium]|nr:twitching motility protein PilT [Solirubrobacterales bacterium]